MSYDTKCHDLAKEFLSDFAYPTEEGEEAAAKELAQVIQDAIEGWIAANTSF